MRDVGCPFVFGVSFTTYLFSLCMASPPCGIYPTSFASHRCKQRSAVSLQWASVVAGITTSWWQFGPWQMDTPAPDGCLRSRSISCQGFVDFARVGDGSLKRQMKKVFKLCSDYFRMIWCCSWCSPLRSYWFAFGCSCTVHIINSQTCSHVCHTDNNSCRLSL